MSSSRISRKDCVGRNNRAKTNRLEGQRKVAPRRKRRLALHMESN